jgi:ankyrin repeat protein
MTVDVTPILLEHGAEINVVSSEGTPLYYVSRDGRLEILRLLLELEHGAGVHIREPGRKTPFEVATNRGHTQDWSMERMKNHKVAAAGADNIVLVLVLCHSETSFLIFAIGICEGYLI